MKRLGSLSIVPAEIKWYHDSIPMNYGIILDIRNESAVAALPCMSGTFINIITLSIPTSLRSVMPITLWANTAE